MAAGRKSEAGNEAIFEIVPMPLERRKLPAAGEVHLWYLHLGELLGTLKAALDPGAPVDQEQHFRPRHFRFARRFYLRLLLGTYLNVPGKSVSIVHASRGKPALDHSIHSENLHFSIAKSGDRQLIGIAAGSALGVDLEPAAREVRGTLRLAQRYFSAVEVAALRALPADQHRPAFVRTWACKEAVVKASGEGIANQLCRFTVETDPNKPARMLDVESGDARRWTLRLVRPEEGFLGAVAIEQPELKARCFRLVPGGAERG